MRSISIFHLGSSWFDPTFFSQDPHTSISHQRSGQLLQRRVTHHPHSHQKHSIWEKTPTHTPPFFLLPFVPGSSVSGILLLHFKPPSHPCLCFPAQGQDQVVDQIHIYQCFSTLGQLSRHSRCLRIHRPFFSQGWRLVGFPGRCSWRVDPSLWRLGQ